jgi:alkaline phosphatase D
MKSLLLCLLLGLGLLPVAAQKPLPNPVQSGPMVGAAEMREVQLWVQLRQAGSVELAYHELGVEDPVVFKTAAVQALERNAYAVHATADQVQPGKRYEASLLVDGKPVKLAQPIRFQSRALWHYRTNPPDFKAAVGSCAYANEPQYDRPGKPYGGDPSIFKSIAAAQPDLMLWLGDNVYLREADWNTRTGILHRYTHARSLPEMQPLLSQAHHYAIWDDHDFGPNDADHAFIHKDKTLDAFKCFWANPSYGLDGQPGITTMFSWSDCDFFLLDNRYHRTGPGLAGGEGTLLGQAQLDWLIDALAASQASFKFIAVGGMVISTCDNYEDYIHIYPKERKALLDAIQREKIEGVVFLTGDRHHTELSKYHPEGGIPIYDWTVSPLTSKSYPGDGEQNTLLVKGSEFTDPNFGMIEVTGEFRSRKLTLRVCDAAGKVQWSQEIQQPEFKKP